MPTWHRPRCKNLAYTNERKTKCRAIAGRAARCCCKFRYVSKFTAASRGSHCDNNAFELNNSRNHGKIMTLNISIYCLLIHYLTHIVCAIHTSDRLKCWNCTYVRYIFRMMKIDFIVLAFSDFFLAYLALKYDACGTYWQRKVLMLKVTDAGHDDYCRVTIDAPPRGTPRNVRIYFIFLKKLDL